MLTGLLPGAGAGEPVVEIEGWNVAPIKLTPQPIALK